MFSRPEPPAVEVTIPGLPPAEQRIHDEEILDRFRAWRTLVDTTRDMLAEVRRPTQEADRREADRREDGQ